MSTKRIRGRRREERAEEPEPAAKSFDEPSLPGRIKVAVDQGSQVQALAFGLEDPKARARLIALGVDGDSFTIAEYDALWKVVEIAHERDLVLDQSTVAAYVEDPKLVELAASIRIHKPPDANLLDVVERLRWGAGIVNAAELIPDFSELLRKRSRPEDVLKAARAVIGALEAARPYGRRHAKNDLVVDERVEQVKLRKIQGRYPFGLPGFDLDTTKSDVDTKFYRTTTGTAPRKVTVLTGLSGNGKSTVLANIVLSQLAYGKKVLYGAWEDDQGDVLELLAAIAQGINLTRLTVGALTEEEEERHALTMRELAEGIVFMPNPLERVRKLRYRNDEALDLIHSYIEESGCSFCVFDLWARAFAFGEEQEEAEALARQQAIAKATNSHVLLVQQQLLKAVEKREDKRPTREGIKGSGEWTGVADTILGVYRPGLYKNIPDTTLEVTILKQRRGRWPVSVEFDFDPEMGKLSNGREVAYDTPGTRHEDSKNELNRAIDKQRKGKK